MSMARSLRDKGMHTQALVHLKDLLRYLPNSDEVNFEIGQTYQQKGDERSAFLAYNKVLELNPQHKAARNALSTLKLRR